MFVRGVGLRIDIWKKRATSRSHFMFINWLPHWEVEGMVELQAMRLIRVFWREPLDISRHFCGDQNQIFSKGSPANLRLRVWLQNQVFLRRFPTVFVETKPGHFAWEVRPSLAVFVATELRKPWDISNHVCGERIQIFFKGSRANLQQCLWWQNWLFLKETLGHFQLCLRWPNLVEVWPISSCACGHRTGYFSGDLRTFPAVFVVLKTGYFSCDVEPSTCLWWPQD